jgi:hypothetical protein
MHSFELTRVLRIVAVCSALLAGACGGGGDSVAGPGGGDDGGTYDLVGVNDQGIPAEVQLEICALLEYRGGTLRLSGDGQWALNVQITNQDDLNDHGQVQQHDDKLTFRSAQFGDTFSGEINGGQVIIDYDFCADGQFDSEFEFEK